MVRMADGKWLCPVCGYVYDSAAEGVDWHELPDHWECPVCGAPKSDFTPLEEEAAEPAPAPAANASPWARGSDEVEDAMAAIHQMAETGESIVEPMRARKAGASWDDLLFLGAQLARLPLDPDEPVSTRTVIGPCAARPMQIETPLFVTHMSFGALSREAQTALARGAAAVGTAIGSGEGGVLPEAMEAAHRFIFEVAPNRYSLTDDVLRRAHAVEIKIGQSAKPGLGGLLPGVKVTPEISAVRGFPVGQDIKSPARFPGVRTAADLAALVADLRERSQGAPIGIKIAAGHIEDDLAVILEAGADFVTIDGRPGGTGAAPRFIKEAASVPLIYALRRARRYLDAHGGSAVSLVATGGLRVSSDVARALALGATAVALGTAAMMACGCQQYRVCHTGRCPMGIATQDAELRSRLDVDEAARRVASFLRVCTRELQEFARMTGHDNVHGLSVDDLCTVSRDIAEYTDVRHA